MTRRKTAECKIIKNTLNKIIYHDSKVTNMKKQLLTVFALSLGSMAFAQVGIHTENPQGSFHVDAGKDNSPTGTPTATQQANDLTMLNTGYVGVGTITPQQQLHIVKANTTSNLTDTNTLLTGIAITGSGSSPNQNGPGIYFENADAPAGEKVMRMNYGQLSTFSRLFTIYGANDDGTDNGGNPAFSVAPYLGRIGVNVNTPNSNLSVQGNASIGSNSTAPSNGLLVSGNTGLGVLSSALINRLSVNGSAVIGPGGSPYFSTAGPAGGLAVQGSVGIGTITPQKKLHVVGGLQITNELNVGGNATTAGSSGTTGQILTSNGVGAAPSWETAPANVNLYTANGTLTGDRVVTQGTSFLRFTPTITNGFSVNGTTFSVDGENNRVGIGTITPLRKFHLNGTMQLTNELNVGGTATTVGSAGTNGQVLTSGGAGTAPSWENPVNLYVANGTLTGNRIVTQGTNTLRFNPTVINGFSVDGVTFSVDGAANKVGIGTNAPETKLHVVANVQSGGRFNIIDATEGTSQNMILSLRNTSPMATGGFSLLGFTNSGPGGGGANWALGSFRTGNTIPTGAEEDFYLGNSTGGNLVERLRIKPNTGNVGIGLSNPTYKLDVFGDINASGAVRANGVVLTSDARLKENIHDTSYGLKTVMALRPVEYQKKNSIQDNNYNKYEIGFLAQDIAKILPSIVSSGSDEFKTLAVSYTELIPVLAKAIQEQQKEIIQLKAENEKLSDAVQHTQTIQKEYIALAQQVKDMQRLLGVKQTQSGIKVAAK